MEELSPLFAAGQRLGRYELLRRLAVGGMAEVYLGSAVGPGDFRKVVAIKRLLPQHALDPQLLRMFLDEARLMARLSHPHVTQVSDVDDGAAGGVPYFVMEYVHGTDLRGVLNAAAGPLPLEQALAITGSVAAGLHHAHEHRGVGGQPLEIVHRDVSPSNVLISFDGGVKITDFGVAKWTEQKSFTHHGQLKGKFAHMSPEQCRGETLDRRSDVFALGTLLYEMTTGHPPFAADSEYDLLTRIVSKDAPLPRRAGEIYPPQLEAILMKSLSRERDQRHPTTQHLQLELEAFARERRLVTSPVALASYLELLFGAQVTEWRQALASGRTLADHLSTRRVPDATSGGQAKAERLRPTVRTATDAFAMIPVPAEVHASGDRAAGMSLSGATDGGPRPRAGKIKLALAITASAATALALLMVATELTSRWQRDGQSRLITPVTAGNGFTLPAASAPAVAESGSASRTVAPMSPLVPPHTGGGGANSPALALPTPRSVPATATRRGREPSTRGARRESPTLAAARGRGGEALPEGSPREVEPVAQAAPANADSSLRPSSPSPRSVPAQTPPPPSVKVWDPDSPVPP